MLILYRNIFSTPRDMVLLVVSIWVGLWLAEKRSTRHKINPNDLTDLVFYPFISFVLGRRILFALENLPAFAQSPKSLISLNIETFDQIGGLVVALLMALIYSQHRKLSLWNTLDALTPVFATFAIGLGLAHLATGSAFGKETSMPWGMELWGATRHPSQIYESLASLLILTLLWFQKADSRPSVHFLTFVALTSGWRLFLEAFRGDSTLIFGGLRLAQIIAWIILAVSLFFLHTLNKERETTT